MSTTISTKEDFYDFLRLYGDCWIAVRFTARWCTPCKRIAPHFERYAKRYENEIAFATIDVDVLPKVADKLHATSLPTVVFLNGGKTEHQVVGNDRAAIKSYITDTVLPDVLLHKHA
jgi:thioredoxin 1